MQWFLHRHLRPGVDRRRLHQLGVDHPGRLGVGRPDLLGVGYAGRHVLDVDRPDRRVVDAGHPGLDLLGVDRAGRHVVDVGHPDRLRRAFPVGKRTGCCPDVGRLGVERPDVVHGCRHGSGRHDVRRSQKSACPAARRTGCCLDVEHLALVLACCLALVLPLAVVHPGLPLVLVLLE